MSSFSAPAQPGSGVAPTDLNGRLLLLKPTSYETGIPTSYGDKDAIRVNVVDLDTGEVHVDTLWFSGMLVGSLKQSIGDKVLARMGQGTAKPGQSAPWILIDASQDADAVARATAWLNAQNTVQAPAATTPPPPPPPAPAPAAVPAQTMASVI